MLPFIVQPVNQESLDSRFGDMCEQFLETPVRQSDAFSDHLKSQLCYSISTLLECLLSNQSVQIISLFVQM